MESRRGHIEVVATVGPASEGARTLAALRAAGADAFRLNLAHASPEWLARTVDAVRRAAPDAAESQLIADLPGRKPRTGELARPLTVRPGDALWLGEVAAAPAGVAAVPFDLGAVDPAPVPGDTVRLRDGQVRLAVGEVGRYGLRAECLDAGELTNRMGVTWGDGEARLRTDAWAGALAACWKLGIRRYLVSYCDGPADLAAVVARLPGPARLVPKIETEAAVNAAATLIAAAACGCIARGDLGTQVPPARLPGIERRLLEAARAAGKGMLLAGGLLPSAAAGQAVTRAERAALHYALVHGATGFILSEETAVGPAPAAAVAELCAIVEAWEEQGTGERVNG
ncbi:MAG TPA: pyruvate kinase [Acidobacteriota bacterium]|nr:pyruvate kinase [Acidobacteriota bacterium]HQM62592.1 pyruvate kinase [Acidobacteriota bacterium]